MKTMMVPPRFGARPSTLLLVVGLLSSTLISGFAYTPKNTVVATVAVGTLPFSLAVSPDSSTVYVGNESSKSISGIDTATNEVGFTIDVSGEPFYLALTPDGKNVYCTLLSAKADLVYSTTTLQLLHRYATGSDPGPQAISPDGTLIYISNYSAGTVTVISNGTLLPPISVGGNPTSVIFSPNGREAYVANQTLPYYISVINTATNTVSETIQPNLPYPYGGMAFSPDGKKLYFTGGDSSLHPVVVVIDLATKTITDTIVLRLSHRFVPGLPAITPDGEFLYVPLSHGTSIPENDKIVMIRTATNTLDGHVIVGSEPVAVAIAPDGSFAYVSNYLSGTVSVIDITPK
jgi:YVTN family beta-propeller protein